MALVEAMTALAHQRIDHPQAGTQCAVHFDDMLVDSWGLHYFELAFRYFTLEAFLDRLEIRLHSAYW